MEPNPQFGKLELVFPDPELLAAMDAERPARIRVLPFVKEGSPASGSALLWRRT